MTGARSDAEPEPYDLYTHNIEMTMAITVTINGATNIDLEGRTLANNKHTVMCIHSATTFERMPVAMPRSAVFCNRLTWYRPTLLRTPC